MKWTAAALAALSAALTLVIALVGAGSGSASAPGAITVTLPSAVTGTGVPPTPAQAARRIRAYARRPAPPVGAAVAAGTSAPVTTVITAAAPAPVGAATPAGTVGASAPPANPDSLPAVRPLTPAADARLNGVSVWVPYWSQGSVATAIGHARLLKVAHPFTDEITDSGAIIDQSGGAAGVMAAQLAAGGVAVVPTITETAGMAAFAAILSRPRRLSRLITDLIALGSAPNVSGVDLDFENLAYGSGDPRQAAFVARRYPVLIGRVCGVLHALQRSCEVTVIAKTDAGRLAGDGLDTGVYDYARLGAEADRVQVMAYDDHVASSGAGPIAPWPWVESVIAYATTQVPAAKLVLGIPAYGYDWGSDGRASSLTATAAEALAGRLGAPILWDKVNAEPYFSYTVTRRSRSRVTRTTVGHHHRRRQTVTVIHLRRVDHVVYFDDATADYDRAVLAADDHLAGVALWAAGDEDPSTWTMLARIPHTP